ncbi:MAG TPA: UDP-N-acetylglucosamine 1-carboxyvinyltransferase, partial [Deltaproteobacteria bacterium]|nr:UDP-N-acetylglucosamine 1-carboxyvinyltransferase [Deltaproteobacteria bacterium]
VVDLANYLNSLGAKIDGAGSHIITIEGVKELNTPKPYRVIPDRIEAGTLLVAAGITGGEVTITNCIPSHLESIIHKLQETGMTFDIGDNWVTARSADQILSTDVKTLPFPGFPTDMQAQFMALMCLGNGTSVITEQIFENRFMHVSELRRLGADISIDGRTAVVKGVKELLGAKVMATDLRASASLVLAGLAAKGITEVSRVYHLDRGYDRLEKKLSALGAKIERTKE